MRPFVAGVLLLACSCTHRTAVVVQPTALPAVQPLPHHVALVLDQEFSGYEHVYHEGGDTFIFELGAPVQIYARQVTTQTFGKVDVVSSVEKAAETSAGLILIPRAVKSDVNIPVWAQGEETLTFVVSWTAKDRTTQNTVWLATITAQGTETKWNVNVHSGGKLYQSLFDDLSRKTLEAFQEAPELRVDVDRWDEAAGHHHVVA